MAAGKTKFAKELAEELEMCFIPAPSMEDIYINSYGYDLRQLDDKLPEGVKSYDTKRFNLEPTHRLAGSHQINNLYLRIIRYTDCLAHILSTGQGVVTVKSPYSDYVFLEAMYRCNFLSAGVRSAYYDLKKNVIDELMKPHLCIYLDVPVAKTRENIKKRNIDYEVNSKALTDQFLQEIEYGYKQSYLKEISEHAELLVYDWSEGGETEVVVEDIERIDFDSYGHYDPKMQDWRIMTEWEWCEKRMEYTWNKDMIDAQFNVPRFDVPELVMTAEDSEILEEVATNAPGEKFIHGYNADMGDTGIWKKTRNDLDPKYTF